MTDRLKFSSLAAKGPEQIRRELRNLWERCIPFPQAIEMVGAGNHPRRAEFEAFWATLED
jgi:hypothetical protein